MVLVGEVLWVFSLKTSHSRMVERSYLMATTVLFSSASLGLGWLAFKTRDCHQAES